MDRQKNEAVLVVPRLARLKIDSKARFLSHQVLPVLFSYLSGEDGMALGHYFGVE